MKVKPIKQKKCAVCKTPFDVYMSTTKVCSIPCAIKHTEASKARLNKKREALDKREHKKALEAIKPKSYWFGRAQYWFNKFIRMRDENKACISSDGSSQCSRQRHAGHYRTVGSSPHLRFNEHNCHGQCARCNNWLSGNLINYRRNLVKRIGEEALESLEANHVPKHYTIDDIKKIELYYKTKCKEMENENNT